MIKMSFFAMTLWIGTCALVVVKIAEISDISWLQVFGPFLSVVIVVLVFFVLLFFYRMYIDLYLLVKKGQR